MSQEKENENSNLPVLKGGHVDIGAVLFEAVSKGTAIETLERIISLRNQIEKEVARKEYYAAMSLLQSMIPPIPKKHAVLNKDGRSIRYHYAKLDDIVNAIKVPLAECGFSYRLETEFPQDNRGPLVDTRIIVTHVGGHSETSSFRIPVQFSDFMNQAQSYASAGSYGARYAICKAFGIVPDEDDDGQSTGRIIESEVVRPPEKKAGNGGGAEKKGAGGIPENDGFIDGSVTGFFDAKNNKPASIKLDGTWYNTFNTDVAALAKTLKGKPVMARLYFKDNKSGDKVYRNAVWMETPKQQESAPAPEPPADPDSPPQTPEEAF